MLTCLVITYFLFYMRNTLINLLQKLNIQGSFLRTIIYTIGHMMIAVSCLMVIANVPFHIAMTDAIVEPLLNGVWYYVLDRYWASRVVENKVDPNLEYSKH